MNPEDTCCACYGCPTCDHECGLPENVAARNVAVHNAIIAHTLGGELDTTLVHHCSECDAYMDVDRALKHNCRKIKRTR